MSRGQLISIPFVAIVIFVFAVLAKGDPAPRTLQQQIEDAKREAELEAERDAEWAAWSAWWSEIIKVNKCQYIVRPQGDGSYRVENC